MNEPEQQPDYVTHEQLKKHFKPRLKAMSKNNLIDVIIEMSIKLTELQKKEKEDA